MNKLPFLLLMNTCVLIISIGALFGNSYVPASWNAIYLSVIVVFLICVFIVFYYFYFLFFCGQRNLKYSVISGFLFSMLFIVIYIFSLLFFLLEVFFGGRSICEDTKTMKYCFDPSWIERHIGAILIVFAFFILVDFVFIKISSFINKYIKKGESSKF